MFPANTKSTDELTESLEAASEIQLDPIAATSTVVSDPSLTKIENSSRTNKIGWRKYIGIMFTLLTSLAFTGNNLINKILTNRGYHPLTITFWRYQGLTIITPFIILYIWIFNHQNVLGTLWQGQGKWLTIFYLFLRSTISWIGLALYVYSLRYLNLANATVISCSTPIVVLIIARIFLKEPCGIVPVIAAFVTLIGVIILSRPPLITGKESFDENALIGTSLAIGTMLSLASLFVILRYLRKEHYTVSMLFFGYIATVEGLIAALALGVLEPPRSLEDWLINIGNAVLALLNQIFFVLALKYEEAGPVAIIRTADIVFAFIFQLLILQVTPDILSIVGATIIMLGILCSAFRKLVSGLPDGHPSKIKYGFILK